MSAPRISVAIATYRRRELLERVIRAVENQTVPQTEFEVIVCDSGSGDGTSEMMTGLMAEFPNLRYVDLEVNTLAAKRNAGVREARAPLVIFLDDDAVPKTEFVAGHLEAHQRGERQFVCGNVCFPEAWIEKSNYFRFRNSRHLGPSRPEVDLDNIPYHMIVVMNGSFRKDDILHRVGLVSEEFQRYGGEDYEFGYRIATAGLKIRFAPNATVEHHEHGGSIRQYMKKLYITSRDSLPVLYRLAPESRSSALLRFLEAPAGDATWVSRLTSRAIRLVLSPGLIDLAERYLEVTDGQPWCYSPLLFRFAFAGAMLRGIRDRENGAYPVTTGGAIAGHTSSGGGWFE